MQTLTPEEKVRLNKIFGASAFSGTFAIEDGDLDKVYDRSKELRLITGEPTPQITEFEDLKKHIDRLNTYGTANPVRIAYVILTDCLYGGKPLEPLDVIEEALGYLKEALTE